MQWQVFSTKVTGHGFGSENQNFFLEGGGSGGEGDLRLSTNLFIFYFLWGRLSIIYISHMPQKVKTLRTEYNFLLLSIIEVKL